MKLGLFKRQEAPKEIADEKSCYARVMDLMKSRQLSEAYAIICRWRIISGQQGLGIDWETELRRGLDSDDDVILRQLYAESLPPKVISSAIYAILSGASNQDVAKMHCEICPGVSAEIESQLRYLQSKYSTLKDLKVAEETGDKYVIFTATLDSQTCPACGEMDGKRIKISDGVAGVNLPPIHSGCRCTLVCGMAVGELKKTKRCMRNPQTNKSEVIPYITYTQWKKKYMNDGADRE